jgi:hypothetical protein
MRRPKNDAAPVSGGAGVHKQSSPRQPISPHSRPQLASALECAVWGFAVIALYEPLHCGEKACCTCAKCAACRHIGKHPRYSPRTLTNGAHSATTNEAVIRGWWSTWPEANLGVATGQISNLLVIDIDPRHGGDDSFDELVALLGPVPDTVEVLTGGGGRHLYFQHVPGSKRGELGAGVDVLSDGKFVVGPGSMHPGGRWYSWELSSDPSQVAVAELPERWKEFLLKAGRGVGGEYRDNSEDRENGGEQPTPVVPAFPANPALPADPVPPTPLDPDDRWPPERVIEQTLPRGPGKHDTKTFDLARGLKLNVGLATLADAQPYFDEWFRRAGPYISNTDWDEGWMKFARAWPLAKLPLGTKNLAAEAFLRAQTAAPPKVAMAARTERTRLLITMLRELALIVQGPFKLSSHQLGHLFGVTHVRAWEWLNGLEALSVIRRVHRGSSGRPGHGAATIEYIGGD